MKKPWGTLLCGFLAGSVNGLLGTGGGMIVVPLLSKLGLSEKESHATSLAVILPICAVSAGWYLWMGGTSLSDSLPYLPGGAVGAVIGSLLLRKIKPKLLRQVFAVIMIGAGLRLVFR